MIKNEKKNAKQMPATYFVRHMTPGVCGYNDGNVLVDLNTIKKMAPTFAGKPVYVGHQPVFVDTIEKDADGYVFDCFYNPEDGWFWSRISVHSDAAHKAVRDGWSVSNAYLPSEYGVGGEYLNVDYSQKVLNGEFTHLAIVQNPRYEQATIMTPEQFRAYQDEKRNELRHLQNSKTEKTKGFTMFTFNRKKEVTEEITNAADLKDTDVAIIDGKEVTYGKFKELLNAKAKKNDVDDKADKDVDDKANKKNEADDKDDKKNSVVDDPKVGSEALNKKNADDADDENQNDDDKVTVDGEEVSMKDLKNSYRNGKKNAKKNSEDDDKEKSNSKDKDSGKNHFEELRNANNKKSPIVIAEVVTDKVARGAERY